MSDKKRTTKETLLDLQDAIVRELLSQAKGKEAKMQASAIMAGRAILRDNGILVEPVPGDASDILNGGPDDDDDIDINDGYDYDNVTPLRRR